MNPPLPLLPGQTAGRFRIDSVLGAGGMGAVFAATDLLIDRTVALKVMLPAALADSELVERFAREARAAAKLTTEYATRIFEVGTLPDVGPFIAMEYLEGETLARLVTRSGPVDARRAALFAVQVCEALEEAHAHDIVHRDLKPANLFLTRRRGKEIVKVLDFGISKMGAPSTPTPAGPVDALETQDAQLTQASTVLGTLHFMSPEQLASSRDVDGRADIWALGAVVFYLLTARRPYEHGGTFLELALKVMTEPPTRPSTYVDVPPELERIVMRCLERDIERRYPSAASLAQDLEKFLGQAAPHVPATPSDPSARASTKGVGEPASPTLVSSRGAARDETLAMTTPPGAESGSSLARPRTVPLPIRPMRPSEPSLASEPGAPSAPPSRRTRSALLALLAAAGLAGAVMVATRERSVATMPAPIVMAEAASQPRASEPAAPLPSPSPPESSASAPAVPAPARPPKGQAPRRPLVSAAVSAAPAGAPPAAPARPTSEIPNER
jgi:eukaryotic-like serine/threonine-protein kinase